MWLDKAVDYTETIMATIIQEYPNDLRHTMRDADDRPTPREIHPAFYGSFDWHSCVEMHWAVVRLMRLAPERLPLDDIRAVLNAHFNPDALATEADYLAEHPGFSRPYGQGWALALVAELQLWEDDLYAQHWAAAAARLGETIAANLVAWLPKLTYPVRHGVHPNTAFGLSRALPYARSRPELGLAEAIEAAARRWFIDDVDYPAAWEPSGADFLSPALTEADLMAAVLPGEEFAAWFDRFVPALPDSLTAPATVSDTTDGQLAHLPGLNFSRAVCFKRIARALPDGHAMVTVLRDAATAHDAAALPYATGGDYMTEHWLAAYAVMSLSEDSAAQDSLADSAAEDSSADV
jgi:hypothetical protein